MSEHTSTYDAQNEAHETTVVRAVCPGSFDPITRGHLNIIERAHRVFPEVIVAVGRNSNKNYLFDLDERLELVRDAIKDMPGVSAEPLDNLLVDFCAEHHASVIAKGLRFGSDFDYELQFAHINNSIAGVETVLFPAGREFGTISSTILRELAFNHGDLSEFVTPAVNAAVREKLGY